MAGRANGDQGRPTSGSLLGDDASGTAHGAALGAGGIEGWWAWKHRNRTRKGVDSVSPATSRGTINVVLWLVGLAVITVLGSLLLDWPPAVWLGIGLIVMFAVGRWWDARSRRSSTSRGAV